MLMRVYLTSRSISHPAAMMIFCSIPPRKTKNLNVNWRRLHVSSSIRIQSTYVMGGVEGRQLLEDQCVLTMKG
jgi:hypothetical protein